jgi:hypothetical protein
MVIDYVIVAAVVASAVGYLGWTFVPRRRKPVASCSACPKNH